MNDPNCSFPDPNAAKAWTRAIPSIFLCVFRAFAVKRVLLRIFRRGGVRLPDGYIFHRDASAGDRPKTSVGLVVKILRDVFRRRVQLDKRLNIVEHLMVETV